MIHKELVIRYTLFFDSPIKKPFFYDRSKLTFIAFIKARKKRTRVMMKQKVSETVSLQKSVYHHPIGFKKQCI